MANQLPQQSIRPPPHPATSGDRPWSANAHLRSPKGRRKLDPCGGGVGLAIVVALDETAGAENTPPPTVIVSSVASSRRIGGGHSQFQKTSNLYSGGTFTAASVCSGEFPAEYPATMIGGAFEGFQVDDFLSRCNLCKKWLHGKDIYMYRGEKGFCSTECRYQQMISDENQEIYGSETPKSTYGDAELAVRRRQDLLSGPCCILTAFAHN